MNEPFITGKNKQIVSKAEFARIRGVNRSTVTRYGKAGRLVETPNGKVKVQESIAKINATEGHRTDLKQKHAQSRGQAIKAPESTQNLPAGEDLDDMSVTEQQVGRDRAQYKAIAVDIGNKQIKLQESLKRGLRLPRDDFNKQIAQDAGQLKSAIERLIDNLAPQLAQIKDHTARVQLIQTEINQLQTTKAKDDKAS